MSGFLLCPMTEGKGIGPVSQLLAVAEELTLRGHDCAFVASPRHSNLLRGLGFRCFDAPMPDKSDPSAPDFRAADAARALGVMDVEYFAKALAFEQQAVDAYRPDALVSAVKFTTAVTARTRELPLVSVAASTDSPTFISPLYPDPVGDVLSADMADFLAAHGLGDVADLAELSYERSDFRVAPFAQEFDPFLPTERLRYVGPLLSRAFDLYRPMPALPDAERDLVVAYINLGSQPVTHYLQTLRAAAAAHPSRRFVVVEQSPAAPRGSHGNLTVVDSAPILRLLQRAALFITGGGYNAIMAALLTGTPIVGIPGLAAERDFNLRRVAALGAGKFVPGYPADPDQVLATIARVLDKPDFRGRAGEAGDRLRRLPGAAGVVAILEHIREWPPSQHRVASVGEMR